jgi:beta-lactamase class A
MSGLFFQPAADLSAPLANTWQEFDRKLKALAPQVGFLAAEIKGDELISLHEINPGRRLAIGSTFKIYILGENARQVAAGTASWTEEMEIKDEWKSLPAGDMRNETTGTRFTLQHFAEQMISVSDNTATDHLLFRAGRENVERFQTEMGHGAPEVNVPFLSTRETFILKLGSRDQAQEYSSADASRRREILAGIADKSLPSLNDPSVSSWVKPRYIDEIEWFASPEDLGRAMATFIELSFTTPRVILSRNPGAPFDKKIWKYIGYKGGSEPGVLNNTWLLGSEDGRWVVITVGLNDISEPIDPSDVQGLMLAAANFIADQR